MRLRVVVVEAGAPTTTLGTIEMDAGDFSRTSPMNLSLRREGADQLADMVGRHFRVVTGRQFFMETETGGRFERCTVRRVGPGGVELLCLGPEGPRDDF